METTKDLNRACHFPKCICTENDNCYHRLIKEATRPESFGWKIFKALLIAIVTICLLLFIGTLGGCRGQQYCHTYSSSSYNAGQKHYPGKFNQIKPRKAP